MEFESADEGGEGEDKTLETARNIRLPTGSLSPEKRRSPSPDPYPNGEVDFGQTFGGVVKQEVDEGTIQSPTTPENNNNCMNL